MPAIPLLSPNDLERIKILYETGCSSPQIAQIFGVSPVAICKRLQQMSVIRRIQQDAQTKYKANHDFFNNIALESQAYWLGFIAADGYISSEAKTSSPALVITLSSKDFEHLEKLKKDISSTHPIKIRSYFSCGTIATLYIRSHKICAALSLWGIVKNKGNTLPFPSNLSPTLLRHFIRGYIDGDGGFYDLESTNKQRGKIKNPTFSVTGNQIFIEHLQNNLMQICNLQKTKFDIRHKSNFNIVTMRYVGHLQLSRIINYLYCDSTITMERKYRVSQIILENASRNLAQRGITALGGPPSQPDYRSASG